MSANSSAVEKSGLTSVFIYFIHVILFVVHANPRALFLEDDQYELEKPDNAFAWAIIQTVSLSAIETFHHYMIYLRSHLFTKGVMQIHSFECKMHSLDEFLGTRC